MTISAYILYLALVFLSISMNKHYKVVISTNINKNYQISSKLIGNTLLIISLVLFIKTTGLSLGITYFFGFLALYIIIIALFLTYKPKLLIFTIFIPLLVRVLIKFLLN